MSILRTSLCVLLSLMMVAIPLSESVAQEAPTTEDYLAGKADGVTEGRGGGAWFFAGFFCGVFGILIAYAVTPTVETDQLVGKSPDYVRGYMDGYKKVARRKNGGSAVNGCLVGMTISLLIGTIMQVSAASK